MLKMLHSVKISFCILSISALAGCGSLINDAATQRAAVYDRVGVDVIIEPTTGNSFVLTDEKIFDQFCMAPPPDLSDVKGSSGSVSVKGVSLSDNTSVSVAALGGRSPAVLISREILFRTCELYVNLRLTKTEAIALFKDSISEVVDVTKSQIAQGTGSQIDTDGANNQGASPDSGSGGGPDSGSGGGPDSGSGGGPASGSGYGPASGSGYGPASGSGDGPASGSGDGPASGMGGGPASGSGG